MDVLPVTIAENISGKTAEETDFPKLYDCMKKSVIYDKVMSLPQKENTHLVKTAELFNMQSSYYNEMEADKNA